MSTQTTGRPATDRQIAFLSRLLTERDLTQDWTDLSTTTEAARSAAARTAVSTLEQVKADGIVPTAHMYSLVIDLVMRAPKKAEAIAAEAKPGYYVTTDGTAIKVVQNKAKTHTYGNVWSGSSWDYAPGIGRTLAGLEPMTAEQAAKIGLASGRCIHCCRTLGGKSLTAQAAALVGYGETCAANNGWAFPKGAAAQRAIVAAAV
jgi:hypothetical protein